MKAVELKKMAIVVAVAMLSLTACNSAKKQDSTDMAQNTNKDLISKDMKDEADFLVDAAAINLKEIELGKLAMDRAVKKETKDFATMMVNDHQQAFNEEKSLAESKGITLPNSPDDDAMKAKDDLSKKTGLDFDKDYADKMVNGHEDAIDRFQKAIDKCDDQDVKNWAGKMLPSLQNHLDHAKMCKDDLEKAKS